MASEEKLKILYLMKILLEETDQSHTLNASQLCEKISSNYGLSYERKTIYTDIDRLKVYGIKIGQKKGRNWGYYVEERDFGLPELKLLVDAVQSSKFITRQKSEELIGKLEKLTNRDNARQLHRQVFIYNRIKAGNDSIYSNVDSIHAAIRDNLQISFKYCEWTINKELVPRKGGADYIVSPWVLTWDNGNYYLVGFENDKIKHYRVDKIQEVTILDKERLGKEQFMNFDLAEFATKTFGMYGGEDRRLTLEGTGNISGVVIDQFGTDIIMVPYGKDRFRTTVTVSVSPQFFGWVAGLGGSIRIVSPEDVREEYKTYIEKIITSY